MAAQNGHDFLVYKARVKEREESFVWAMHVDDSAFLLNDTHSTSYMRPGKMEQPDRDI
jgi:hypothetical protein